MEWRMSGRDVGVDGVVYEGEGWRSGERMRGMEERMEWKMRLKGMNSLFGLQVHITVGECMIVAVATATAVYLASLPPPPLPKVLAKGEKSDVSSSHLQKLNKRVTEVVTKNKEHYAIFPLEQVTMMLESSPQGVHTDDSDDEPVNELELSAGNKDTFVLEVDDAEDAELVSTLIDPIPPTGFDVCNTEMMPGVPYVVCNVQMFTQVWRGRLGTISNRAFSQVCDDIIRSLFFKLRAMRPCCLNHLSFDVDLPEDDEIQVSLTGMCLGVGEPRVSLPPPTIPTTSHQHNTHRQGNADELLFHMELHTDSAATSHTKEQPTPRQFSRSASATVEKTQTQDVRLHNERRYCNGVLLTPLSSIPGGHIQNYLGHFNFFIIRESTSVREVYSQLKLSSHMPASSTRNPIG
ncbi:C2 domain-containing protein 5 [Lamellibrachia satsuma]|nr:C2 domain-containing protein 5 [Lamellibrachia satsuma]